MSARQEHIAEIVKSALDRDPASRERYLNEACADNPELRAEVDSLLQFQGGASQFIEQGALHVAAETLAGDPALPFPQQIDNYQVISRIGVGGMGEVYVAHDTKLKRRVALKLIRAGMDSAEVASRFRHEEQILASLNHPNIAQLYGAGVAGGDLPFFAMEYVEGLRIDEYARTQSLSVRARLELFRKVCSAVHYAHQRLVIHRDLKPSNILVTAKGEPKLLDFGIAKLIEGQDSFTRLQTTLPGMMTPDYASPEQVRGEAITTATDVYSLGVLLYELLTGQRPYRLKTRSADEIARAITDQAPEPPSKSQIATRKSHILRGDLDNIVLMALRKEAERRYKSVEQFSEDVRRHLEGRPVFAHRDSVSYRAVKFVQRNKVAVAAAAVVLVSLVGGIIATAWQAQNARRQRDLAQRERAKAERINSFLQEMLGSAAVEAKGMDVKVSDVLSEASRRARTELASQPEVMAAVLMTVGRTGVSISTFDRAEADLRAAVETSVKSSGELNPITANSMGWLSLALSYLGKNEEGTRIGRRAVDLLRQLYPAGHEDLGIALYSTGVNLYASGDAKAAEVCLIEAVAMMKRYLGEQHGYYLATLGALGLAVERSGRFDEAEALYREAIAKGRGVEGRYRIFLAQASGYLGIGLTNQGRYREAAEPLAEAEAIYREIFGDTGPSIAFIKLYKARGQLLAGDMHGAAAEYRDAVERLSKHHSPQDPWVINARAGWAVALTRLGDVQAAETELRAALELRRQASSADDIAVATVESALGECLTAQRRFEEAEPFLLAASETLKKRLPGNDSRVVETRARLFTLYDSWGKPELAAPFRAEG